MISSLSAKTPCPGRGQAWGGADAWPALMSPKSLSPNHGLIAKLKRQARRIYRQSPRRLVLIIALSVLKASVVLYWTLPFLCPKSCVLRRIPALHSIFPELPDGAQLPSSQVSRCLRMAARWLCQGAS